MLSLPLARHALMLLCHVEPGRLCCSSAAVVVSRHVEHSETCTTVNVSLLSGQVMPCSSPLAVSRVTSSTACVADAFGGIDSGDYAALAAQLGVLQQLATLSKQTWTNPVGDCVTQTLLNLVCAVITAFELSPFTLPADQLQATTNILVGLYEGASLVKHSVQCWHVKNTL